MRQALARSPGGDDVSPIKRRSAKQPAVETSKKVFSHRYAASGRRFRLDSNPSICKPIPARSQAATSRAGFSPLLDLKIRFSEGTGAD